MALASKQKAATKRMTPAAQLTAFIARYAPDIVAHARAVLTKMRARLPGAVELVYDNYNGLVVGFGPSERASEAPFSIVLYPRWITLFFLRGAQLHDPQHLLQGTGSTVRHLRLEGPGTLEQASVRRLMDQALLAACWSPNRQRRRLLVIKAIVAKQRPRRPPAKGVRTPRF